MNYLITGGAGFIGSALCRLLAENAEDRVIVLDRLTYAGSMGNLRSLAGKPNFRFARGDIRNRSSSAACWPAKTSTPSCRREPCRPIHRQARDGHRHERHGDARAA